VPASLLSRYAGDLDPAPASRATKASAERLWASMQRPAWNRLSMEVFEEQVRAWAPGSDHSDAVVVVDAFGNVVSLLHTINTGTWGTTGIVVDGVSIADPGASQQPAIARAGPGARLPEPTNPLIVLKDGKPVLASSSIGMGVHETTLQGLVNVLEYGLDPKAAVDTAQFLRPLVGGMGSVRSVAVATPGSQVVVEGEFAESLLDAVRAHGQPITAVPPAQAGSWRGGWVGITIDPVSGRRRAAAARHYDGWALAY
jgi:gamma-glutamyltranspeptidase/glutathione hydrolase